VVGYGLLESLELAGDLSVSGVSRVSITDVAIVRSSPWSSIAGRLGMMRSQAILWRRGRGAPSAHRHMKSISYPAFTPERSPAVATGSVHMPAPQRLNHIGAPALRLGAVPV
jgi:hypothetical protein